MVSTKNRVSKNGNGHVESAIELATGPEEPVTIRPPMFNEVTFRIVGTAPYVQLKFSEKTKNKMMATQQAGEKSKSRKARDARDFDSDYESALHRFPDGKFGIPATAIKAALVSACRLAGVPMTRAKLLVHVVQDGLDGESGDPLIFIEGKPQKIISPVRNANGSADLRVRAQWVTWSANVTIRYDAGCIAGEDVMNLLMRAGMQVGIGEGRPDSKKSCGQGWGTFEVTLEGKKK